MAVERVAVEQMADAAVPVERLADGQRSHSPHLSGRFQPP
jgi:hypothetical protein